MSQLNCRILQLEGDTSALHTQKEENRVAIELLMRKLEEAGCREEQQVRGQAVPGKWLEGGLSGWWRPRRKEGTPGVKKRTNPGEMGPPEQLW